MNSLQKRAGSQRNEDLTLGRLASHYLRTWLGLRSFPISNRFVDDLIAEDL